MFTLSNFYKSSEWKKLIHILKLQRINDDGFVICEHCGQPIVKAYDIIGHHKQHLTEENVNDYNVSLNPDNIILVHHKCHNEIHERFLTTSNRKVYVVWGSPLSGKTSYVEGVKQYGDLIVDMDSIWQCLSGCDRYIKPKRIKSNVFGVRDSLLEQVQYRRGKWNNCYIIGGYPFSGERERLLDRLGAEDIHIDTTKEECLQRLERCDDGRDKELWTQYINDWWKKYNRT